MAGKLWFFYLITTSIAVALGLFFVLTIRPGYCDNRDEIRRNWQEQKAQLQTEYNSQEETIKEAQIQTSFAIIKKNMEGSIVNPFKALTESQSLGIIFFAILLGVALIVVGLASRRVIPVIRGINAAIMKITVWLMAGSPFFIFCLVASLVGGFGPGIFVTLMWYVITVLIGIAAHIVVLLAICYFVGKVPPHRGRGGTGRRTDHYGPGRQRRGVVCRIYSTYFRC